MVSAGRFVLLAVLVALFYNYLAASAVLAACYGLVTPSLYRHGYTALMMGVPALIVLLGELLSYMVISLGLTEVSGGQHFRILVRGYILASLPALLMYAPLLLVGYADIIAGGGLAEVVASTVYVWGSYATLYAAFVHPVYAAYAALATVIQAARVKNGFAKTLVECASLFPRVLVAVVASSIIAGQAARLLTAWFPVLGEPLLELRISVPDTDWARKWLTVAEEVMPKHYEIVAAAVKYTMYAYLASKLLRERVRSKC